MSNLPKYVDTLSPRQLRACLDITAEQRDEAKAENTKLREQNRRLKAAIARVKRCHKYTRENSGPYLYRSDVLAALRLRK